MEVNRLEMPQHIIDDWDDRLTFLVELTATLSGLNLRLQGENMGKERK
jgi:hypothetical protein